MNRCIDELKPMIIMDKVTEFFCIIDDSSKNLDEERCESDSFL